MLPTAPRPFTVAPSRVIGAAGAAPSAVASGPGNLSCDRGD
ncbi:hypothetical protein OKW18_001085 [Streptomyces pratensis]|nr:hypothetical protein [Streptomyces pratensis]